MNTNPSNIFTNMKDNATQNLNNTYLSSGINSSIHTSYDTSSKFLFKINIENFSNNQVIANTTSQPNYLHSNPQTISYPNINNSLNSNSYDLLKNSNDTSSRAFTTSNYGNPNIIYSTFTNTNAVPDVGQNNYVN